MIRQIQLPRYLFLVSAGIALVTPFVARLPAVPFRGIEWLTDYAVGLAGLLFFSAFNLIPAIALWALKRPSRQAPLAYWIAVAGLIAFLLWAHGTINLRSSSTAAIGLIFIPVYAVGAVLIGWVVGRVAHAVAKDEGGRVWMAGIAFTAAAVGGVSLSITESRSIERREARFPAVTVKDIVLARREVTNCCAVGAVSVLALNNFDGSPEKQIAVLGNSGLALLQPSTYLVKTSTAFKQQDCESCVHMYPQLAADPDRGVLIATSDGVSDSGGRLLWKNDATGFSKTLPVLMPELGLVFLLYYGNDRIELRGVGGKLLWNVKLPVSSVVVYVDADKAEWPAAITGYGTSRQLRIFDKAGKETKAIPLPEWASNVQSIAWPSPGHLLVGGGSWMAILSPDGREVLRHVIQGTSFNPYHGPDGVVVRFKSAEAPYLVVASHGSSGYPRSVLLGFDPRGRLVWQEEVNKVRSLLSVPASATSTEALLVGGMDGVVEYGVPGSSVPGPNGAK